MSKVQEWLAQLTEGKNALKQFLRDEATVDVLVHIVEYDAEREEPAHGSEPLTVWLHFPIADVLNGSVRAANTAHSVAPETTKRFQLKRGRAFVVRAVFKVTGGNATRVAFLFDQVKLQPYDATSLPVRTIGSLKEDDAVELLVDSDKCVVGVRYTMSAAKHTTLILRYIDSEATYSAVDHFIH